MDHDKLFERYSRIRALSEQGVGGEKDNATRKRLQMEAQHPWLTVHWANVHEPAEDEDEDEEDEWDEDDEEDEEDEDEEPSESAPSWRDLLFRAQKLYDVANGLYGDFSQARVGIQLANASKITSQVSRAGNLLLGATVPEKVADQLAQCSRAQRLAFRQRLIEKLGAELDEILGLDG